MAVRDRAKQRAASRRHYEANRERVKARAREHHVRVREDVRAWLLAYLRDHPCVDCGETNPIVLEFDHVGDDKHFNIGEANSRRMSLKRVQIEVAKCEVRCANCHRAKTYRENGRTHRG
jgi:hypothetical protein